MAFDLGSVTRMTILSPITLSFSSGDHQEIGLPLNFGSLLKSDINVKAQDQNGDGSIQAGETLVRERSWPLSNQNYEVIGVGYQTFPLDSTKYPILLVKGPPLGAQYVIYPEGAPNILNDITGTLYSTLHFDKDGSYNPDDGYVCFTRGTLILTDRGEVPVEDLQVGDLVQTADHGLQPIRWIGSHVVTPTRLQADERLLPIRIAAGALGDNMPAKDLLVSPQHRVLVRSEISHRMFGTDEILVAAKQLCQLEGIDIAHDMVEVEYFHILFDQHEIVFSNGAATESLFTGAVALKSVGRAAREEIFNLFPELQDMDYEAKGVRPLASGRMGRKLAVRHKQNQRHLVN